MKLPKQFKFKSKRNGFKDEIFTYVESTSKGANVSAANSNIMFHRFEKEEIKMLLAEKLWIMIDNSQEAELERAVEDAERFYRESMDLAIRGVQLAKANLKAYKDIQNDKI